MNPLLKGDTDSKQITSQRTTPSPAQQNSSSNSSGDNILTKTKICDEQSQLIKNSETDLISRENVRQVVIQNLSEEVKLTENVRHLAVPSTKESSFN